MTRGTTQQTFAAIPERISKLVVCCTYCVKSSGSCNGRCWISTCNMLALAVASGGGTMISTSNLHMRYRNQITGCLKACSSMPPFTCLVDAARGQLHWACWWPRQSQCPSVGSGRLWRFGRLPHQEASAIEPRFVPHVIVHCPSGGRAHLSA